MTRFLERAPSAVFVGYAITAAFTTYFCMYAFRKPFAAAKFEGEFLLGSSVELKTALVISQIIGYALSKYVGIKVCSEVTPARRAPLLLLLIGWAQAALVLYGLLPDDWKFIAIFLNGLPLGMVWGLVVWYLEGRRTSELLLAGLSLSFIIASGVVKDFGRALMEGGVAQWWQAVPVVGAAVGNMLGKVSEGWMPAAIVISTAPVALERTSLRSTIVSRLPARSTTSTGERRLGAFIGGSPRRRRR